MMRSVALTGLWMAALGVAAEELGQHPVVRVGGTTVTLRQLEDELLRREGVDLIRDLVEQQLQHIDWSALHDNDVLLAMPGWGLPRASLAARLLSSKGGEVREDLINLILVRQALERAGLVIDKPFIDAEVATLRRRFAEQLKAEGKPQVEFDAYIQKTQGMSLEEWIQQPGFEILAGVHALLYQSPLISEQEIEAWFRAHYRTYSQSEAVDLSVLYMPFHKGGAGEATPNERQATVKLAESFHRGLREGRMPWEKIWRMLRAEDPSLGRKGWVTREGTAETLGQSDVPPVVIAQVFQARAPADGEEPVLLDPIVHDSGVSIIRVHARRPARAATLEAVRTQVIRDLVDADLDTWSKRFLAELRRQAGEGIVYEPMADLLNTRRLQAQEVLNRSAQTLLQDALRMDDLQPKAGTTQAPSAPTPSTP